MTNKTPRRVIHCIAQCKVCGWTAQAYKTAAREAAIHARKTNHIVTVEQGVTYNVHA